jgi:predicted XRE-type DNA-binding protein
MVRSSYEILLNQFELNYPHFASRMVDWWKSGPYHVTFLLDNGDRVEFDSSENTIRYLKVINRSTDNEAFRKEIGRNIRKFITYTGMRQQDVSEKAGITQAMLSRYINGTSMPGLDKLHSLACVLGCHVEDLIGSDD